MDCVIRGGIRDWLPAVDLRLAVQVKPAVIATSIVAAILLMALGIEIQRLHWELDQMAQQTRHLSDVVRRLETAVELTE